nr:hypothetical protein [Tanacetum cinerariifolium]
MVRSMMSLATLPLSFWDYPLESDVRILNMVPTKKIDKTPYELWHEKVPNLSYLKIDPDRLCFNVEVEEHSLGDLNEPANYKVALSDLEFEKWLVAMNAEMQSMILIAIAAYYDYEIWQMDVKTVFLNGFLEEEIYMELKVLLILIIPGKYVSFKDPFMDLKMKRMQNVPYASAVGSIMYAMRCTRPNVAFAQNITSRFQQNFGEAHWTAVKNILKYLRNTKDTFLVYGGDLETELRVNCYCDAGFETDRDDMKSQTGKFIDELGVVPLNDYPIKMNYNNSAAIIMAKESEIQKGARHFKRKYHYVRECIETGEIDIVKVHTDDNLADPFTKALAGPKFTRHARSMGLRPASSFM